MRKIASVLLCSGFILPVLYVSGCGGAREGRNRYVIRAEYFPEERRVSAEMTVTVVNRAENALGELRFALYPNAYREDARYRPVSLLYEAAAYYKGKSYGNIEIGAVEGGESFSVCGEDENVLAVTLKDDLYPDESVSLTMSFEVTLAEINHRLGVGEHTVNLANFYPVLEPYGKDGFTDLVYAPYGDPFVSACADYDVAVTVPADYTVCGGNFKEEKDGKAVWSLSAENVRDVAFVLGTDFRCERAEGSVPVAYYYREESDPARTVKAAAECLSFYSEEFGAYAYPQYTVVETDFPYGGMEYPMLSMIAADLAETEIVPVVAHETAHQWWYAMVGSDQYSEAWQDEGLAELSAALFLDAHPAYGQTYADFISRSENAYRAFYSIRSQISGEADTRMTKPLTDYGGEYEYRSIAYDKGVILFDTIRSVAGNRKFMAGLRDYCSRYSGKIASAADMVACFHRKGARVEELVKSFTEGTCII